MSKKDRQQILRAMGRTYYRQHTDFGIGKVQKYKGLTEKLGKLNITYQGAQMTPTELIDMALNTVIEGYRPTRSYTLREKEGSNNEYLLKDFYLEDMSGK